MDNTSRPAAFFDLDRTLIDTNSGILFAMEERRTRRISTLQFLTSLYWGALYHFNLIDIDRAYHKAVQLYKGQHTDDLERITRDWFESRVRHRIRPGAQKILAWHKSRGHPLILLTNSSCYLSENVSSAYELDGWLANTFPLDDHGRISGELEYPLCYGEGKLVRAREWAKDSGYCVED
ncbi:haloacid dehalogenase-like hydrolase, partial [Myxococcota bacterium]|nr:haloacid dehalogenase-like hydrolase [Myxococcota bacterium]